LAQRLIMYAVLDYPQAAFDVAEQLIAFSRARQMDYYECVANVYLAWAKGLRLDPQMGLAGLEAALEAYERQGNRLNLPIYLLLLAQAAARAGESEQALTHIERGLAEADESGQKSAESLLHGFRGAIFLRRDSNNAGVAAALQAIEIARRQQARSLELIVTLPFVEWLYAQGRLEEGRRLLLDAMAGFTPLGILPATQAGFALL
jgi:hypothetical protein